MMPWSRCNCWSRRESGRAITVTSWPARASWYANVLPILPAPMMAIDKCDLAAGAIFFMTTSSLIRSHPVRGWLSVDDVACREASLSVAKASQPIGYILYEVLLLIFTLVLTNACRDSYSRLVGNSYLGIISGLPVVRSS